MLGVNKEKEDWFSTGITVHSELKQTAKAFFTNSIAHEKGKIKLIFVKKTLSSISLIMVYFAAARNLNL